MLRIIIGLVSFLDKIGLLGGLTFLLGKVNLNRIWNLGHDNDDPDFEWWEFYGKHPSKGFKREMARLVKELAGDGDRVLSLGCGCSPILNMFHGFKVGVDINKAKLDFFGQYTDAELVEADITRMVPIGKFDIVLLNEVLEHVGTESTDKVLQLVSESLVEGGRAIISMPDMDNRQGQVVENLIHKASHRSLMGGMDLVEKCKRYGLAFRDRRNWKWDVAFLFVKE